MIHIYIIAKICFKNLNAQPGQHDLYMPQKRPGFDHLNLCSKPEHLNIPLNKEH